MGGAVASHQIISDECRTNRGDAGAINEAISRIYDEAEVILQNWPVGSEMKLHFQLIVERKAELPEDAA